MCYDLDYFSVDVLLLELAGKRATWSELFLAILAGVRVGGLAYSPVLLSLSV